MKDPGKKPTRHPVDLVRVHRAKTTMEADIVRLVLEDAGIVAVIPDQNNPLPAMDLTPFDGEYSPVGCDVLVSSEVLDRARQVIAEAREAGKLAVEGAEGPPPAPGKEP